MEEHALDLGGEAEPFRDSRGIAMEEHGLGGVLLSGQYLAS